MSSADARVMAAAKRARRAKAALQAQNDVLVVANRQLAEDNDRLTEVAESALDMVKEQHKAIDALLKRLWDGRGA